MTADGSTAPDLSAKAVTARLKRVSQLRALCLSLAAAGRRAGLHDRPTVERLSHTEARLRR